MEEAVPRIDVDAAYAEVQQGRSVLIDVRSAASYGAQHARGALHVPVEDVEVNPKAALGGLPAAKRLITYCT
jgi:rhodanese-related sulfurtransferase